MINLLRYRNVHGRLVCLASIGTIISDASFHPNESQKRVDRREKEIPAPSCAVASFQEAERATLENATVDYSLTSPSRRPLSFSPSARSPLPSSKVEEVVAPSSSIVHACTRVPSPLILCTLYATRSTSPGLVQ